MEPVLFTLPLISMEPNRGSLLKEHGLPGPPDRQVPCELVVGYPAEILLRPAQEACWREKTKKVNSRLRKDHSSRDQHGPQDPPRASFLQETPLGLDFMFAGEEEGSIDWECLVGSENLRVSLQNSLQLASVGFPKDNRTFLEKGGVWRYAVSLANDTCGHLPMRLDPTNEAQKGLPTSL